MPGTVLVARFRGGVFAQHELARAIGAADLPGIADPQVDRGMAQHPAAVAADGGCCDLDDFVRRHDTLILKAGAKTVAPPITE